jgi:hypothetical protein
MSIQKRQLVVTGPRLARIFCVRLGKGQRFAGGFAAAFPRFGLRCASLGSLALLSAVTSARSWGRPAANFAAIKSAPEIN